MDSRAERAAGLVSSTGDVDPKCYLWSAVALVLRRLHTSCLARFLAASRRQSVGCQAHLVRVLRNIPRLADCRRKGAVYAAAEPVDNDIARPALRPVRAALSAGAGVVTADLERELKRLTVLGVERAEWKSSTATILPAVEEAATCRTLFLPLQG